MRSSPQIAGAVAVNISHNLQHVVNIAINWRNELKQRFSEISSDPLMGQRGTQRLWMARRCKTAIRVYAQRFALKTTLNTPFRA